MPDIFAKTARTPGRILSKALSFVCMLALLMAFAESSEAASPPDPPTEVTAADVSMDGGGAVKVNWTASDSDGVTGYELWRSETDQESKDRQAGERKTAMDDALNQAYAAEYSRLVDVEGVSPEDAESQARGVARNAVRQAGSIGPPTEVGPHGKYWVLVDSFGPKSNSAQVDNLTNGKSYTFIVYAVGTTSDGMPVLSVASAETGSVIPAMSYFDKGKTFLLLILVVLCGAVLFFIIVARKGGTLKIRPIAGLKAVDEAVGRATEMGRPILYVNGIQDMDDLQTVAGITVLGHVSKTAAEYDAKIEVPTSRSLVMSAARETVQSSYMAAGRLDAYNPDLIYYVTDEQFGFTAYVSGLIVRDKPAACFYMGAFFAESLILAETGNSVGAIQIAGTAMPSQLPFFVAACDYTLIGEEFFAASAYLSGQPDQLGSLKGQDMGKIFVGVLLIVGCLLATLGTIGFTFAEPVVDFIRNTLLQG